VATRKPNSSGRPGDGDEQDGRPGSPGATLRVDKWLWCARFFKTRGTAQEAVDGGHVQLNGDRIKSSRQVKVGDQLQITRERERFLVEVVSIPSRRGPAAEARQLYRESAESEAARAHQRELHRLSGPVSTGRPGKRDRRELMRVVKGRGGLPGNDEHE
jgi:ribosome-associated heat shock protein Hsp15